MGALQGEAGLEKQGWRCVRSRALLVSLCQILGGLSHRTFILFHVRYCIMAYYWKLKLMTDINTCYFAI